MLYILPILYSIISVIASVNAGPITKSGLTNTSIGALKKPTLYGTCFLLSTYINSNSETELLDLETNIGLVAMLDQWVGSEYNSQLEIDDEFETFQGINVDKEEDRNIKWTVGTPLAQGDISKNVEEPPTPEAEMEEEEEESTERNNGGQRSALSSASPPESSSSEIESMAAPGTDNSTSASAPTVEDTNKTDSTTPTENAERSGALNNDSLQTGNETTPSNSTLTDDSPSSNSNTTEADTNTDSSESAPDASSEKAPEDPGTLDNHDSSWGDNPGSKDEIEDISNNGDSKTPKDVEACIQASSKNATKREAVQIKIRSNTQTTAKDPICVFFNATLPSLKSQLLKELNASSSEFVLVPSDKFASTELNDVAKKCVEDKKCSSNSSATLIDLNDAKKKVGDYVRNNEEFLSIIGVVKTTSGSNDSSIVDCKEKDSVSLDIWTAASSKQTICVRSSTIISSLPTILTKATSKSSFQIFATTASGNQWDSAIIAAKKGLIAYNSVFLIGDAKSVMLPKTQISSAGKSLQLFVVDAQASSVDSSIKLVADSVPATSSKSGPLPCSEKGAVFIDVLSPSAVHASANTKPICVSLKTTMPDLFNLIRQRFTSSTNRVLFIESSKTFSDARAASAQRRPSAVVLESSVINVNLNSPLLSSKTVLTLPLIQRDNGQFVAQFYVVNAAPSSSTTASNALANAISVGGGVDCYSKDAVYVSAMGEDKSLIASESSQQPLCVSATTPAQQVIKLVQKRANSTSNTFIVDRGNQFGSTSSLASAKQVIDGNLASSGTVSRLRVANFTSADTVAKAFPVVTASNGWKVIQIYLWKGSSSSSSSSASTIPQSSANCEVRISIRDGSRTATDCIDVKRSTSPSTVLSIIQKHFKSATASSVIFDIGTNYGSEKMLRYAADILNNERRDENLLVFTSGSTGQYVTSNRTIQTYVIDSVARERYQTSFVSCTSASISVLAKSKTMIYTDGAGKKLCVPRDTTTKQLQRIVGKFIHMETGLTLFYTRNSDYATNAKTVDIALNNFIAKKENDPANSLFMLKPENPTAVSTFVQTLAPPNAANIVQLYVVTQSNGATTASPASTVSSSSAAQKPTVASPASATVKSNGVNSATTGTTSSTSNICSKVSNPVRISVRRQQAPSVPTEICLSGKTQLSAAITQIAQKLNIGRDKLDLYIDTTTTFATTSSTALLPKCLAPKPDATVCGSQIVAVKTLSSTNPVLSSLPKSKSVLQLFAVTKV